MVGTFVLVNTSMACQKNKLSFQAMNLKVTPTKKKMKTPNALPFKPVKQAAGQVDFSLIRGVRVGTVGHDFLNQSKISAGQGCRQCQIGIGV